VHCSNQENREGPSVFFIWIFLNLIFKNSDACLARIRSHIRRRLYFSLSDPLSLLLFPPLRPPLPSSVCFSFCRQAYFDQYANPTGFEPAQGGIVQRLRRSFPKIFSEPHLLSFAGASQVKLILSPKQRAKPKTSARKTGSSMPHCVIRWVWLLRVLRSGGE
jgi:hypothetical protein